MDELQSSTPKDALKVVAKSKQQKSSEKRGFYQLTTT